MADKTCKHELNRQMQVMQARLKSLEDNVAALQETQMADIGQTCAAMIALLAEGMVTGLPTYIANQVILKIAAAMLGMSMESLQDFPGMGAVGEFTSQAGEMVDKWKEIMEALSQPMIDWRMLFFELMMAKLNIPPFLDIAEGMLAAAEAAVLAAQEALSGDPLNEELIAALTAALDMRDTIDSAAASQTNLTKCKMMSKLLGLQTA